MQPRAKKRAKVLKKFAPARGICYKQGQSSQRKEGERKEFKKRIQRALSTESKGRTHHRLASGHLEEKGNRQ